MAATAAGPHLVASAGATTSKTLLVACLAAAAAAEACWRDRISQQKNLTAATKCLLPEPANAAYISPPHTRRLFPPTPPPPHTQRQPFITS